MVLFFCVQPTDTTFRNFRLACSRFSCPSTILSCLRTGALCRHLQSNATSLVPGSVLQSKALEVRGLCDFELLLPSFVRCTDVAVVWSGQPIGADYDRAGACCSVTPQDNDRATSQKSTYLIRSTSQLIRPLTPPLPTFPVAAVYGNSQNAWAVEK